MSIDYQLDLVAFSVAIAILASYTALRLAYRLAWVSATSRRWWIAGGALALGFGIWAMHFVGMLAAHLPVPVAYDPWWTALSLLPAVLATAVALTALAQDRRGPRARLQAAALMGLGIVTMHYSGMAAMRMQPPIRYDAALVGLSVLIAVAASWAAIQLLLAERRAAGLTPLRRSLSAVLMGLAIAGMHYTGMAAARFAPDAVCTVADTGLSGQTLGLLVGAVAVLILLGSLALTLLDQILGENSFFRALLAAQSDAGEGVLVVAGSRVLYANAAMADISGRSREQLLALGDWRELVQGPALALPAHDGASAHGGRGQRLELMLAHAHGPKPCEVVLCAFAHAEEVRHLLLWRDVSARYVAEQALRELNETLEQRVQARTQELQAANDSLNRSLEQLRQTQAQLVQAEKLAALGALVAGIAHEINTPLGIAVTSATALQGELLQLTQEFETGHLRRSTLQQALRHGLEGTDILVRNLRRAAELIRSFKQVAVDQSSQEQRPVDLGRYIDEVILSLRPQFRGGLIRIEHDSEPGLVIDTYPGAIAQILSNLLINAQLHGYEEGQGGAIRVQARRVGTEVEILCADDGKGIAPEIRDRVFEPFFTTRRGRGGSGLGLHIVYNLVTGTLKGRIELLSADGPGTVFRIRFPLQAPDAQATAERG
jgi:NO-binding membrane sensor protein with MHYT domain/nitrogen-specific signal transduction histidine kinase